MAVSLDPLSKRIYHLVDIRIFDASSPGVYPIELSVPGHRDFPRGRLRLDMAALLALSADSEAYGRALGDVLFADEAIGSAYHETRAVFEARDGDGLRIRLRLDPPELHDLRWERAYHLVAGAWHPLAATVDTLLSRYVPTQAWEHPTLVATRPLRILVVIASPDNLEQYSLAPISEEEITMWHTVLDGLPETSMTYLQSATANPPTLAQIRQALMEGYHIVHFVAHGARTDRGTVLYLETPEGAVEAVRSERLLEMFRALTARPHLCFLAACESAAPGRAGGLVPLGPALIARGGVPAVVAMSGPVGIVTARQFAGHFYARLLDHGAVDLATHEARAMVRERWDWSVPVLFSRLPDNQLLGSAEKIERIDETRAVQTVIECINRETELRLLSAERLNISRTPYTVISAPAGYGKSYLLRHLVHTIESDQTLHEKWFVRYVDLGSSQDPETPLTAIAGDPWITYIVCAIHTSTNQDPRGEPGLLTEPAATTDAVSTYVIQSLSTPLSQGRRAVLLIFDGVERLGETSRQWLYTLMNDLYTRTHSGYQEIITVRVIVAGRNAETFWEGYEQAYPRLPAPRRINLTPFDEYSIQELIWHQAQLAQVSLDDQTVVQIADEVQYLSGGHPKVIRHLADHVAEQSFAIGPAADYFKLHRGELVQTILSPVAQDLLAGLETQTREAVQALSVFRRVNANTVQALIAAEILPPQTNEIDLLGDLQRAHLLESPGIREPFYHDHYAIRRILSLDMAHSCQESRTRYLRLNGIASNSQYGGMV